MHALLNGACDSKWRVGALAKLDSRVRGNDGLAVLMSPAYGSSLARSVAEPFGKEAMARVLKFQRRVTGAAPGAMPGCEGRSFASKSILSSNWHRPNIAGIKF